MAVPVQTSELVEQKTRKLFKDSWHCIVMVWSVVLFCFYIPPLAGLPKLAVFLFQIIGFIVGWIGINRVKAILNEDTKLIILEVALVISSIILLLLPQHPFSLGIPDANPFPRFDIIPSAFSPNLNQFVPYFWMLAGIYSLCALFYTLYQKDITVDSALKAFTLKKAIHLLLGLFGTITVLVPFIQLVLSLATGKH